MIKRIQESENPKLKGYQLPKNWNCEPHSVIRLNFSDIDLNKIDSSVKKQIINSIYQFESDEKKDEIANSKSKHSAGELLNDICCSIKFPNKVILIDEYDNPLNGNLYNQHNFDKFSESFYKPFFKTIKNAADTSKITQCVLTGILKFSQLDIFSGLFKIF